MEKVVYFIGAGFSAPLGLPVMNNFLIKSKDMYFQNPEKFSYFKDIFSTIDHISKIKHYFSTDLFNIEEIMSILEFQEQLHESNIKNDFKKYIIDVIKYFTPTIGDEDTSAISKTFFPIFGKKEMWNYYGCFISSILNIQIKNLHHIIPPEVITSHSTQYNIISLNYDLIFEHFSEYLKLNFNTINEPKFCRLDIDENIENNIHPLLMKIHGSINHLESIIPPTWNKSLTELLKKQWDVAHKLLSEANHIRVIGYSLPTTDAYVKYLFKSAIVNSDHLKQIDVICLDPQGNVRNRYDDFIDFNYYRFKNLSVEDYLIGNAEQLDLFNSHKQFNHGKLKQGIEFNKLELVHERFMT
jgi:SIR2-like protein